MATLSEVATAPVMADVRGLAARALCCGRMTFALAGMAAALAAESLACTCSIARAVAFGLEIRLEARQRQGFEIP